MSQKDDIDALVDKYFQMDSPSDGLPIAVSPIGKSEISAAIDTLLSGWLTMGRRVAALALVPFVLSVAFVVAGLVLGVSHGVDWIHGWVDGALAALLDVGSLRTMVGLIIAWPLGLIVSVAAGYQVGFLLSLPLLDRLALAVERQQGWEPTGKGLGVAASAMAVCAYMVAWLCGGLVFALLSWLPLIGLVFVGLGWLWSALCIALDALDPTLCRAGLTMRQRLALVIRHPLPVLSFGGFASIWMMLPGSYPGIVVGGARLATTLLKFEAKDPRCEPDRQELGGAGLSDR